MKNGFSLVELSIVLVILGLLTGGILAGQSLIRAAELRAVSAEYSRYITAAMSFRDKYFQLPGDMNNATSFWGANPSGCPLGGGVSGTCNGDGDGEVGTIDWIPARCENFEFWRHLTFAGLIEGSYSTPTSAGCLANPAAGTNMPPGKISSSLWGVYYLGSITSGAVWPGNGFYTADYQNSFIFSKAASPVVGVNYVNIYGILTPTDAWNIDSKSDDGSPDTGRILAVRGGVGYGTVGCQDVDTAGSANYNLSSATNTCSLVFKGGF